MFTLNFVSVFHFSFLHRPVCGSRWLHSLLFIGDTTYAPATYAPPTIARRCRRSKCRRSKCLGAFVAEHLSHFSEQLSAEHMSPEHMSWNPLHHYVSVFHFSFFQVTTLEINDCRLGESSTSLWVSLASLTSRHH